MTDVLILYLLGRSKKLAPLASVWQAILAAKASGDAVPVSARGIRLDGDIYDLFGTLRKRGNEPAAATPLVTPGE